jgi:hypothetical protein
MTKKIIKGKLSMHWETGMENGCLAIQDENFINDEKWAYEGLYFLENGDVVRVKDPITKQVICEGQVDLIALKIFSDTQDGHFEQVNQSLYANIDWAMYFKENYDAELHRG